MSKLLVSLNLHILFTLSNELVDIEPSSQAKCYQHRCAIYVEKLQQKARCHQLSAPNPVTQRFAEVPQQVMQ